MFQFLMKKMLKAQMKGIPESQQEMILAMFEKNPEFFKRLAASIKEKTKAGKTEQQASMEAMMENRAEMQKMAAELQNKR